MICTVKAEMMNGNTVRSERRRIWIVFEFSLMCQFLFAILDGRKRLAGVSDNFEFYSEVVNERYTKL